MASLTVQDWTSRLQKTDDLASSAGGISLVLLFLGTAVVFRLAEYEEVLSFGPSNPLFRLEKILTTPAVRATGHTQAFIVAFSSAFFDDVQCQGAPEASVRGPDVNRYQIRRLLPVLERGFSAPASSSCQSFWWALSNLFHCFFTQRMASTPGARILFRQRLSCQKESKTSHERGKPRS